MCGIVAILDSDRAPGALPVQRALEAIGHRGPDASHIWQSPDQQICLGHTRLSIIDLATGDQPLTNEDQSMHLVVNGEFYDFERIRTDLEARGHHFRTRTDSEILLHLYEDKGVECLHDLRGEYAFVLWDSRKRLLFAARDRFGIKPLFYAHSGSRLIFASEAKALHAAGLPAAWDEEGFWQALSTTSTAPHTLFENVSSLHPGHYLLARGNSVSIHKYWDFDYPLEAEMPPPRSDAEYAEELGYVLDEAVRLRMRADVPVGCYLSGGLDSCSVLGMMARHASAPVRAFSLSFDHPLYDEGPIAQEMAERAGAEFVRIPIRHSDMAHDMSDAVWHSEALFINAGSAAKYALSRVVRDSGYKVVLTGEGSDEILAGYPFYRMDLARSTRTSSAAAGARADLQATNIASRGFMIAETDAPIPPAFSERLGYFPAFLEARMDSLRKIGGALDTKRTPAEQISTLLDRLDVEGQMTGRHVVNQSQYVMNKTGLASYILVCLGDRVEMAHSVEGRLPFLDHKVVEYVRRVPVDQKIRGTVEKFVLREAMKPLLTDTVYRREKHPFLSPPALLKPDEPLNELLQDTLRGKAIDRVPFLKRKGAVALLDSAADADVPGKIALEFPLTMMLSACLLAERFRL